MYRVSTECRTLDRKKIWWKEKKSDVFAHSIWTMRNLFFFKAEKAWITSRTIRNTIDNAQNPTDTICPKNKTATRRVVKWHQIWGKERAKGEKQLLESIQLLHSHLPKYGRRRKCKEKSICCFRRWIKEPFKPGNAHSCLVCGDWWLRKTAPDLRRPSTKPDSLADR